MAVVTLTINDELVSAEEGTSLLSVMRENGIEIPTLCHLDGLSERGGCRLCMVEMIGNNKLQAACVTPVFEGMVVNTTPTVDATRGALTLNADGTFSYVHDSSEATEDTFTYEVCDDNAVPLCSTAVVTITITPVPELESSVPADDAVDVDPTADIELTFESNIRAGTGNITIHLSPAARNSRVCRIAWRSGRCRMIE